MSRAALLRALHGQPVTLSLTYTGPERVEEIAGVKWVRQHGHTTERRGTLEVRSRGLIFWDERWERRPGNGVYFRDLAGARVEGDALVFPRDEFKSVIQRAQ